MKVFIKFLLTPLTARSRPSRVTVALSIGRSSSITTRVSVTCLGVRKVIWTFPPTALGHAFPPVSCLGAGITTLVATPAPP
jgi:hypothetical protein